MDAAAQDGVERGGEGDGHRLALACIHLHHRAPEQVNAGQQLLAGGAEPQATIFVLSSRRPVERAREQDVPRPPVRPLTGHIRHRFGNDSPILTGILTRIANQRRIIEEPPYAQPPVNGLRHDGEALGQQVLSLPVGRAGLQALNGEAQLSVGVGSEVMALDAGHQRVSGAPAAFHQGRPQPSVLPR